MKKFSISISALLLAGCGAPAESSVEAVTRPAPATRRSDLLSVSRDYGSLRVWPGRFEAESAIRPWSAWWLPLRSTYLFEGSASPLSKLDLYAKKVGVALHAASTEREKFYDPDATSWEGSCDAWALASLMEPEPTQAIVREGITFGVGDQKALLIKTYDHSQGKVIYGKPFRGERGADFDDVYADQFHLFVQAELFGKGRPFILDKDPGIPVWNTPIYRVAFDIRPEEAERDRFRVEAMVWGADPGVQHYDEVGTRTVIFRYSYDLYGELQNDGSLVVRFGVWSDSDHPDFVVAVPESVTERSSRNPEIKPDMVDAILRGSES